MSRTWILYNKPTEPNFTHAGLLLALGLHEHLCILTIADVYRYLSQVQLSHLCFLFENYMYLHLLWSNLVFLNLIIWIEKPRCLCRKHMSRTLTLHNSLNL